MITPQMLKDGFSTNTLILKRQTDGLTHEDSLLQLPFRGNCLNWVLGHILDSRCRALKTLGLEPIIPDDSRTRYLSGSEPITQDGEGVMRLETLLSLLEQAESKITAALETLTPEQWEEKQNDLSRAQGLFGLYFHETYHTGQAEPLRQLAGKNDKVI